MQVILVFTLVAICFYQIAAGDLDDCKCWTNHEARKENGQIQCHSTLTLGVVPCNIPEVPNCVCEKAPVTGILTDKDGRWCSGKGPGNKWPCENADEWNQYEVDCKNELYCIPNSHK